MLLGYVGLGLFVLTLHAGFHNIPFQTGGTEIGVPSLGSCVSALNGSRVMLLNQEQGGWNFEQQS